MEGASFGGWMNRQLKVNVISPGPNMLLTFTWREMVFNSESVSRWNCHPKADHLMKRHTAKGYKLRLVQGRLRSTTQQRCDLGQVTESIYVSLSYPIYEVGIRRAQYHTYWRVEKGNTCTDRALEGMIFYVISLSFSTLGGPVSYLSTATVTGRNILWDSIQNALWFINSCHLVPHFQLSENNSSSLHFLNGKGMTLSYQLFLKMMISAVFS